MNYRTLADMSRLIRANLHRIPRLPVVGIPRSGLMAACMIATLKNLPLDKSQKEVLLVDDSVSGGETFAMWKKLYPNAITLAPYVKPSSPKPDIWFEEIPGPRVFEWNWAKHQYTRRAVLDIDGVISTETKPGERNGSLLHWPAKEVLALATGRKEEEREVTECWLAKHNIRYKHIYFSTTERGARQTKLLALQETKASWMVESNYQQAQWLRAHSGRPVLCTDTNQMF